MIGPDFVWAIDLPPFDKDGACPKCGFPGIRVLFHGGKREGFPCWSVVRWILDGHLCRVCNRCGHGWCEASVDTKPARSAALWAVGENHDKEKDE
jgi:hypothetical protein